MYEKDTQEQITEALKILTDDELAACAGGAGEAPGGTPGPEGTPAPQTD